MSATPQRTKLVMDRGLAPSLKQAGFRRSGMTFYRQNGEALQVVNVQSNRWNSNESGSFTINVGVDFAEVAKLMPGYLPMSATPKEYCCILRIRVGDLMPAGKDHWWAITPKTNVEELSAELVGIWTSNIEPWLDKLKTVSSLASQPKPSTWQNPYLRAAANVLVGNQAEAAECIVAEIKRINSDPDAMHPANAKLKDERLAKLLKWAADQNLTIVSDVKHGIVEPEKT